MAAGTGKPSGGPRGSSGSPPTLPGLGPRGGTIAPTGPYGGQSSPSVQPITRRRSSKARTYDELEREEAERRRLQSEPRQPQGKPSDAAERTRGKTEARAALHPSVVRLRDEVAVAVFKVLTDYQKYFREAQGRALVANAISTTVGDTLREIEDTKSRLTSIKRTIETSIDWMTAAVEQRDIPTIKAKILAAIERVVTI